MMSETKPTAETALARRRFERWLMAGQRMTRSQAKARIASLVRALDTLDQRPPGGGKSA